MFNFNHTRQFVVPITEEFTDYCSEGALSIEVYGHRSAGFASTAKWAERLRLAKSLADRYTYDLTVVYNIYNIGSAREPYQMFREWLGDYAA